VYSFYVLHYSGWKQGEYKGSHGSSSSMSKAQMEMRETLRRAGEGDTQIEDANFGIFECF